MLFPNPCTERHTRNTYRLPRPFIAWQPVPQMPEYHAVVSEAPQGAVRIGTFNHNRKFSDEILKIWADLLQRLPDARLVLKLTILMTHLLKNYYVVVFFALN